MKRKNLLFTLLLALMMPLAVNAQSSLPFSENFNLVPVNQLPTDWVLSSTQVGTVTAVVQKETPTSTNRLLLMAVTQLKNGNGALAVQIPENAIGKRYVKLTFKLMPTNANSGTFKVVCASTSFSNPIEVATYNASDLNVGNWNYITTPVSLSSAKTITFMVTTTTANTGWAIDDVNVTDGYKPTNVTTSVLEPNYATISWDYSGVSSYEMQYRMQGETDWTTVTTSSNQYAISELLTNTTYEAQVRGKEGTFYTGWSDLLTFTTPDAFYNFYIAIQNSNRYLYYKVTDSENHYVKVVPPFNSFGDPWGTFAKPEGNVIIPQTVTYGGFTYTVTDIGNYALKGCTGVTGISIPSTITSIGNYAFYNCKLTSLVIPSSVTEINQYAFNNCGNDNGMTVNIAGNATTGTRIETMAFLNSKVSELTLGEGVVFVGEKAFWGCPLLTTVHFNATNCTQMYSTYNSEYYSVFNSGSDNTTHSAVTTLTIGSNATNIPDYAFYDFTSLTEVTISEGVTSIGEQAFWNCPNLATVNFNATNCTNMKTTLNSVSYSSFNSGSDNTTNPAVTTLNIGNNVTNIPDYAFYGFTSLPEVTIGEDVTSIGERAFWKCPNLTTVHFNAINCASMNTAYSNTTYSAFNSGTDDSTNPAITTLTIGSNVTRIPEDAFYHAELIAQDLVIPSSVVYIGKYAFSSCTGITSLEIAAGSQLVTISEGAFNNCTSLSCDIAFPNSLTDIKSYAFRDCKLKDVTIPSSVKYIGAFAFSGCASYTAQMNVTIEGNTTSGTTIEDYAFYDSFIKQLTIGEGVKKIGKRAFWKCPYLLTVNFNAINCTDMQSEYETSGQTYHLSVFNSGNTNTTTPSITSLTIGPNVTRIPAYAFYNCNQITDDHFVIPSSVQYIGNNAFYGCGGITNLSFADGSQLVSIGENAFAENGISNCLYFPNGMTSIGQQAFYHCPIFDITIPSSVTTIGSEAFRGCGKWVNKMNVTIEGNTTSGTTIGDHAFFGSFLRRLTIGEGVTSIGEQAFGNNVYLLFVNFNAVNCTYMKSESTGSGNHSVFYCNCEEYGITYLGPQIATLDIGSNVTRIPEYAFHDCDSITNAIVIPSSVQYIEDNAFYGCGGITNLSFADGSQLVSIGENAFAENGISNCLYFPNGMTSIGQRAFYHCPIFDITIPSSVTTIGSEAFRGCGKWVNKMNVTIEGNTTSGTTIGDHAFFGSFLRRLTIGEGVTSIGEQAFGNNVYLLFVNFNAVNCTYMKSESTGSGNHSVFYCNCEEYGITYLGPQIATLDIGSNVTRIPEYAFHDCDSITNAIVIPSSVQYIEDNAFYGCGGITNLSFADGSQLVSIGENAFAENGISNNLYFPNGLTTIGQRAFYHCPIFYITIPSSVTTIGSEAFRGCGKWVNKMTVTIEGNTTSGTTIGDYAFFGSYISRLTIGEGVTSIGEQAFGNNVYLTTVNFNAINCTNMQSYISGYGNQSVFYCNYTEGSNSYIGPQIATLTIGPNVTRIPNYAFYGCQYASVQLDIPKVTSIGKSAFYNCVLATDLNIGNNVITIGDEAFYNCNLITGDLVLSNTTSIGSSAFQGTSLDGVLVLGQGISTIGASAFKQCAFTDIIVEPATMPAAGNEAFANMSTTPRVYVPYGQKSAYQSAIGWSQLTNYFEQYEYIANNGNWVRTDNWANGAAPSVSNVVCINADNALMNEDGARVKFLYVRSGKTLNVTAKLTATLGVHTPSASSLVIKENSAQHGQLVNPSNYTFGTVQKSITGYGTESNKSGWYTVAAPVQESLSVNGLAVGEYDLYYYDEPSRNWKNQKVAANNFTTINPAMGYLYAKQTTGNAEFAGLLNPQDASFTVPVTSTTSSDNLAGFNLVGNPYTYNININNVKINGTALTQYYKVEGGSGLMAYATEEPIRTGEGFLVKAIANGNLTFNMSSRGEKANDSYLRLVLSQDGRMADRAYLRLNEGDVLEKMVIDDAQSLLYFEEDDERYAIAPNSNEKSVPLYFEPSANGHFTIDASLLNAECDYLHLIDNLTGADVNLLEVPEYTFNAKTTDYAYRFKVVFATGSSEGTETGTFGFVNASGNLCIYGIEGEATVQVIDVLGHVLSSEQFSGSYERKINGAPGIYVVRLINGENVKVQKVVVR